MRSGAILAFDLIDVRVVRDVLVVNLDRSLCVGRFGPAVLLVGILVMLLLLLGTGTAVTLFLTCETDLFFVSRREVCGDRRRRVLTFPSGFFGEFEFDLFVGLLCLGLDPFWVFVGGGENAERNGDAGFKVQIGDLSRRRVLFSTG